MKQLTLLLLVGLCLSCSKQETTFTFADETPQISFAVANIKDAIANKSTAEISYRNIEFSIDDSKSEQDGYTISVEDNKVLISASHTNGLMYGGLEVAEQIELNGHVENSSHQPYIKRRGIKMNIPLDARTPSYDDSGDAAQLNIATMWDWTFWEAYIDQLAIHRFNVLTLWNPHPFPSMIKLENYPDVALDDIAVTTLTPIGVENEWAEPQMVSSNVIDNLKIIKELTIEEKITFWQKVMQHAHDRGIDIYYFTWNVCPNGAANPVPPFYRTYDQKPWDEAPGKHGISNQMDNPITVQYYREAVKTFLLTYPHVQGIGVTAGEHMYDHTDLYTREQWIWETYGKGMQDVQEEQPDREVDFIHRVWNTDMDKIMTYWDNYSGSFEASFKYAKARLYSSPTLPFADKHNASMKKYGLKSWWNLRNDDIFVHRWGNPDYVRDFINHFDKDYTAGFYMGSDGYLWGREFISKAPTLSGEMEIHKHWYRYLLWGRLAYNHDLDSTFFIKKIAQHFPQTQAHKLYLAWKTASQIIPKVNCFHWNNWDYQWAVEACIDTRIGFHDINRFIENPTLERSGLLNPADFAKATANHKELKGTTPYEVAEALRTYAQQSVALVSELRQDDHSVELKTLLDDLESMAYLGQYYAAKIEAATELALYRATDQKHNQEQAIGLLYQAVDHWKAYSELFASNYRPQMLARTGYFDCKEILKAVEKDIEIAKATP